MTDDCMEPKWYEEDCFFQVRRPASDTLIDGFANLRHVHQVNILQHLGISACGSGTVKPYRAVNSEQSPLKKCNVDAKMTLEEEIEKQNRGYFILRAKLKLNAGIDDRIAILEANDQFVPKSNSDVNYPFCVCHKSNDSNNLLVPQILSHLTDVMYFGAMAPCSVCKNGNFVFVNTIYCCNGNVSEWLKCVNTIKEPKRVPVQIPEKYQKSLRGSFEVRTRILKSAPEINDHDYAYDNKVVTPCATTISFSYLYR